MSANCSRACVWVVGVAALAGVGVSETRAAAQDLLVSTFTGHSVSRFDGATGAYLGEFVTPGSGGLRKADGICFGPDGNLYVGDSAGMENPNTPGTVIRYNGRTGAFIDTFASGGELYVPWDLAFGPDGNLYVSSSYRSWVSRYNGTTGAFIDYFVPDGSGGLSGPNGILFRGDYLYVATASDPSDPFGRVLRYSALTGAFVDEFIPPLSGGLKVPAFMTFGPDGNLYVTGWSSYAVHRYNGTTGAFVDLFVPPGTLSNPAGLAFGPDGNLYVASWGNSRVQRYDGTTGAFLGTFASFTAPNRPWSIVFTPEPGTLALLGAGVVGVAVRRRRSAWAWW